MAKDSGSSSWIKCFKAFWSNMMPKGKENSEHLRESNVKREVKWGNTGEKTVSDLLIERLGKFWESLQATSKNVEEADRHLEDFTKSLKDSAAKEMLADMLTTTSRLELTPLSPIMEAVPHLHFPEKVVLDYFQMGDSMGSMPILYVRNLGEQRIADDRGVRFLGAQMLRHSGENGDSKFVHFMQVVQPEVTAEGAWELLLLNLIGNQFNLRWHARYHLFWVLYDWHEFLVEKTYFGNKICNEFEIVESRLSEEAKREIMSWDCKPSVTVENDKITIHYCMFSPFAGFIKADSTVLFKPELKLMPVIEKKRVEYDCGIDY